MQKIAITEDLYYIFRSNEKGIEFLQSARFDRWTNDYRLAQQYAFKDSTSIIRRYTADFTPYYFGTTKDAAGKTKEFREYLNQLQALLREKPSILSYQDGSIL